MRKTARLALAQNVTLFAYMLFVGTPVFANDSEGGRTATGGLEFLQNDHVRIKSEDLFISEEIIRVEYTYENTHSEEVEIQVAFPIQLDCSDGVHATLVDECIKRLDFNTWVNGEKISWLPYIGSNVHYGNLCMRLWLQRNQIFDKYGYCFSGVSGQSVFDNSDCSTENPDLSDADRFHVSEIRIIEQENSCSAAPVILPVNPFESTEVINAEDYVSIIRTQAFPANSLTKVVHEYRPDVGRGIPWHGWQEPPQLYSKADWEPVPDDLGQFQSRFGCTSLAEYNSAIQIWENIDIEGSAPHHEASYWLLYESRLRYVLVTGANWSGPIEQFRLEIDTKNRQIINTCFDGLQRVSDTSLVFEATNYVPTQNLDVQFHSLERR